MAATAWAGVQPRQAAGSTRRSTAPQPCRTQAAASSCAAAAMRGSSAASAARVPPPPAWRAAKRSTAPRRCSSSAPPAVAEQPGSSSCRSSPTASSSSTTKKGAGADTKASCCASSRWQPSCRPGAGGSRGGRRGFRNGAPGEHTQQPEHGHGKAQRRLAARQPAPAARASRHKQASKQAGASAGTHLHVGHAQQHPLLAAGARAQQVAAALHLGQWVLVCRGRRRGRTVCFEAARSDGNGGRPDSGTQAAAGPCPCGASTHHKPCPPAVPTPQALPAAAAKQPASSNAERAHLRCGRRAHRRRRRGCGR